MMAQGHPLFSSPFPPDVAFVWGGEAPPAEPPAGERALVGPAASARRRADFAAGRACAREALARLGWEGAARQPLLRGQGRAPAWPQGVVGSITHTAGRAAAATAWAASYAGIGLDLERAGRVSPRVMARICRPEEREWLDGLSPAQRGPKVAAIFSAKESVFKALNPATGVYLGFQDATVGLSTDGGADGGGLAWVLRRDCGPRFPEGFRGEGRFLLGGGFVLTGVWVPRGAGA